jgi:hypothetical protein
MAFVLLKYFSFVENVCRSECPHVHISAYRDKNCQGKDVQSNEAVVMEIMEPYFSKRYTLYTSN